LANKFDGKLINTGTDYAMLPSILDQNREEEIKEEKKWEGRNQSIGMPD